MARATGRYPILDPIDQGTIDTTDLAAIAAWHVLQGFLSALSQLDPQNDKIVSGDIKGVALNFNTLGIGNGLIDEYIQAPYHPEFAVNNTYGIKSINDTVYNHARFALNMINGCLEQITACRAAAADGGYNASTPISSPSLPATFILCSEAQDMCRDNVEGPYYSYSGRGTYDIRHPKKEPTPPNYFVDYLDQAFVQNAIGVDLNYTKANEDVTYAFQSTGDWVFPNFREDLEYLLDRGLRVSLYYGDADYLCNWFGGEAVSLAVNYTHAAELAAAG
ncbi:hypothetical protein B0A48_06283 [Cryoendolithus antarcticus]|uniref:Carboxypeptidase n=1 Tax=Cryoendolithus antarcticus TaxID=1507870 RepID=A0A1V8TAH7_9PEZI|nr:hypothetical protein B0A48_06283 [Cryoendolithus antarcticus]